MNLTDVSIHVDIWCSLNGRFYQRMFDPRIDLLTASWSPFEKVTWVLPLLTELSGWRKKMKQIQEEVYSASNFSDVLFVADFPGKLISNNISRIFPEIILYRSFFFADMYLENFVDESLNNVTLTALQGRVRVKLQNNRTFELNTGETKEIPNDEFHEVHTISQTPSCYMYLFYNRSLMEMNAHPEIRPVTTDIFSDIRKRIKGINRSIYLIGEAIVTILSEHVLS